ncbi:hypothetical protein PPL_01934 [Heterostelium album PN500]|uniref:Uncharacterized protein n=1 Tax=Heterostelium pallidum (strain ATCC 26659 / Pp 5 / PN500) TaxID=670386 RepID=D3B0W7_HETP5|nr:hypothetical protein PPL_01934 [Heterostelium album PN500]EFA84941.1 hypothetical protein PPL_01934 [Heterostelium album PN500]|eukprot:XP_020437051.1 hypothetical protein PPL_01934 [Heterostelium album PN500]
MFKQSIYLILLLNIFSSTMLVQADCTQQLASYFNFNSHLLQMTAVMRNGQVFYTRQTITPFNVGPNILMLTNGNSFDVLCSDNNKCVNGASQTFSTKINSFFDAKGINIYPNGQVNLYPLWRIPADPVYRFNLTCSPTSNVFYGFAQENYFAFSFVNGTTVGSSC